MLKLNQTEIQKRLASIQTILDVHHNHPAVECRKIYELVGEIMYPKDDIDTGESVKDIPIHTVRENNVQQFDPAYLQNHKPIESYDKMYALIGQIKKVSARAKQRVDNPFGVAIGRYSECPVCHDVGIEFLQRDYSADGNITYMRHVFNHHNGTIHSEQLCSAKGKLTYEQMVDLKKAGKMQ
jgi:hypothetical protein